MFPVILLPEVVREVVIIQPDYQICFYSQISRTSCCCFRDKINVDGQCVICEHVAFCKDI